MCGICAYFGDADSGAPQRVRAMMRAQAHRGPDGVGICASRLGETGSIVRFADSIEALDAPSDVPACCVLGHNWLAIQDRADNARQPMQRGDLTLIFNGEIYNFLELRDDLERQGESFTTRSDTEVLLRLWQREGAACLDKLRGMFAFVVFDAAKRTMHAVRDPFGIKPLYFAESAGDIHIASEMRSLFAAGIPRTFRETAVLACVAAAVNEFGLAETLYAHIRELPPGHFMVINDDGHRLERYYRLPAPGGDLHDEAAIAHLRAEVTESVRLHLRSIRRIATCLSGGLDSTNLAWLIGENIDLAGEQFRAYTIHSANQFSSEIELAKLVTQEASLPHHIYECGSTIDPAQVLEMAIAYETPNHTVGPINQFLLLRRIAEEGATVVLDGQGGDELLSGYPWYWPVLIKAIEQRGGDVRRLQELRPQRLPLRPEVAALFDERFHSIDAWVHAVMGDDFLGVRAQDIKALDETRYYLRGGGDWKPFRERAYFRGEMQYLLRQEDRLGMWFGLECRVPYVDRRLIDYASCLSPELLIRDSYLKYPFRVMIPEVPEQIRWNTRKQGFWDTDPKRYGWMKPLASELAQSSDVLPRLFPRLAQDLDLLNFNQLWRLAQIGLLERCCDRGGARSHIPDLLRGVSAPPVQDGA